jgi:hypothetical protein
MASAAASALAVEEPNVIFRPISRAEAEAMLEPLAQGNYLVRPSSRPGCLSLSYRRPRGELPTITHLLLMKTPSGWSKEDDQGKHFATVRGLLEWLTKSISLLLDHSDLPDTTGKGPVPLFSKSSPPTVVTGFDLPPIITPEESSAYRVELGTVYQGGDESVSRELQELKTRRVALVGNAAELEAQLAQAPGDVENAELLRMLQREVERLDRRIVQKESHLNDPTQRMMDLTTELEAVDDLYVQEFQMAPHMNFVGMSGEKEGSELQHEVVSVLRTPQEGVYKALRTHRKGSSVFEIPGWELRGNRKTTELDALVAKWLNEQYEGRDYYRIHNHEAFAKELAKVESKHPQKKAAVKMALIYSTAAHPTGKENNMASPAFKKFLELMGHKIKLETWSGYKGDMKASEGETYFASWRGIDFIFHVSTMLTAEQHRRLIGNDIAVIFFREQGALNLDDVDIGTVPQVHAVVQPYTHGSEQTYRMGFFSRTTIKPFGPQLPAQLVFRPQEAKAFLLSRMVNGLVSAMIRSPPMNRLYYVPRGAEIEGSVAKYPKESDKELRQREKAAAAERRKQREAYAGLPRELVAHVIGATNLPPTDKEGLANTYCEVKLQEQRLRTDVVKKSLNPQWNASLRLDLVGVEVDFVTLDVTVYEKGLLSDEAIGHYVCTVADAMRSKVQQTVQLVAAAESAQAISGELTVQFEAEAPEIHVDGDHDLTMFDWYHGNLSGGEAYKLAERYPPGAFLVRTSTKKAGCFVITYKHENGRIIHVLLEKRSNGWTGEGMRTSYPSLVELLRVYKKSYNCPITNGGKWESLRAA